MNAWNRVPKKNSNFMEQNNQDRAINDLNGFNDNRNGNRSASPRRQGYPTRLRYRSADVEVQWLD